MADDEESKGEKGTDGLKRLSGKRVLVTQADDYMGPATLELFAAEGAELIADTSDLTEPGQLPETQVVDEQHPGAKAVLSESE